MFRKLLYTMTMMTFSLSLAAAEEFSAILKKVDGDKVTFAKVTFKDKKFEKGDDETLPAAKDVKVAKGEVSSKDKKLNVKVGDAIEGGLKHEMFTKIDDKKGLLVRITTSEDNKTITQLLVTPFGKKKDDKKTDK
jgi:hypothetical protein